MGILYIYQAFSIKDVEEIAVISFEIDAVLCHFVDLTYKFLLS